MGRALPVALVLTLAGCRGASGAGAASPSSSSVPTPFTVAIEGSCPKLRVHQVGPQTVVVLGTYGLDEAGAWTGRQTAHAAQALALVRPSNPADPASPRTAKMAPALLEGLPRTAKGWVDGDLEIGGSSSDVWLERTVRTPAPASKGALFDVARDGFTWAGARWRPSAGKDASLRGPRTALPAAAILCPSNERGERGADVALSLLAAERTPDGTTFIAGRCEDDLHRPTGPLRLARYDVRGGRWERLDPPPSPLFDGPEAIVNAGILPISALEAWVFAYRPFTDAERGPAYLVHVDLRSSPRASLVAPPFDRPIVSLARAADGALWAVAGFSDLVAMDPTGRWRGPIPVPPPRFVEPAPSSVRLLEVQTTGKDVWVHGAVPIVRADGAAGREHVLYTTARWGETLACDRDGAPGTALATATTKRRLGVVPKRSSVP